MSSRRTQKPKKTPRLSADEMKKVFDRKKKCNAKAQEIVEKLLETVSEVELMDCLLDINQNHMEDVFVERSILKICGWPLCENELTNIPKQQYKISLSSGKVFDITERKMFCGPNCYRSAIYLKEQLLTSPLWMRLDADKPEFKLLSLPSPKPATKKAESVAVSQIEAQMNQLTVN